MSASPGAVSPVEVSAAIFNLGYELDLAGRREDADRVYRHSIALAERWSAECGTAVCALKLARLAFDHGKNLFELGRYDAARSAFGRSLETLNSVVSANVSSEQIEEIAFAQAWLARSQRKSGQVKQAVSSYEKAVELWRSLLLLPKSSIDAERYHHFLGCSLLGLSRAHRALGDEEEAVKHHVLAIEHLDPAMYRRLI